MFPQTVTSIDGMRAHRKQCALCVDSWGFLIELQCDSPVIMLEQSFMCDSFLKIRLYLKSHTFLSLRFSCNIVVGSNNDHESAAVGRSSRTTRCRQRRLRREVSIWQKHKNASDLFWKALARNVLYIFTHSLTIEPRTWNGSGASRRRLLIRDELRRVEDNVTEDHSDSRLSNEMKVISESLRKFLVLLCKVQTTDYVRLAEHGNRLQAWQALLSASTLRNVMGLMRQLFDPHVRQGIRKSIMDNGWNMQARTRPTLLHGYRKNHEQVYLRKIEPQDMTQHLMIDKQRWDFSAFIAAEIEESYGAMGERSSEAQEQLGFVAPVKGGDEKVRRDGHTRCKRRKQEGSA